MINFQGAITTKAAIVLLAVGAIGCSAESASGTPPAEAEPEVEEMEGPVDFNPENFEDHSSESLIGASLDEFTVDELEILEMDECDLAHPDDAAEMEFVEVYNDECRWSLDGLEVTMGATDQIPGATAVGYVLQRAVQGGEPEHEEFMKSIAGYPAYQLVASAEGGPNTMCRTSVAVADDQLLEVGTINLDGDCEEVNEDLATSAIEHLVDSA